MSDVKCRLRLLTTPRTETEAVREALAAAIDAGNDERARELLKRLKTRKGQ